MKMAEETKKPATTTSADATTTKTAATKTAASPTTSQRLAIAAKAAAARAQAKQGTTTTADGETYIDSDPLDKLADADPTGVADPNQFASSSDPVADVYQPATDAIDTEAGAEILPANPGMPNTVGQPDPVAATYGVHSGKIGNTVPIVDDYTPTNPRSGGIIGGAGGPGAVGRVKAEQDRERAAKQLMTALVDGADATRRQIDAESQGEKDGKTKYRVVGGSIFTDAGKTVPGQPVYLTATEAKWFSEMGRIAPWFD